MKSRSLLELLDVHAGFMELLAQHRDLIVGLEFGAAAEALATFETALRRHMEAEEKYVLPLYEERVGTMIGGSPEMFRLEHKNILRNLDDVKKLAKELAANAQAGRRQAHEFLDNETMLLHLLQHHDLRERNILYAELDLKLSEAELTALLAKCDR